MGLRVKGLIISLNCVFTFYIQASGQLPQLNPGVEKRADSLLKTMSLREKIGQMIMTSVYSNKNESYYRNVEYLIRHEHVGGLIFFQGTPGKQTELTHRFQQSSRIPLFVAMDAEWGPAMRLDSLIALPEQMTLGAIRNSAIIYNYGAEVARQLKILGVNMSFGPVLDVNSNPDNPVINVRSFGEDPYNVSIKGTAFLQGLQDNGIIAVGKHFPGHGDTRIDSHHGLPVISHPRALLDSVELLPFKTAIRKGIKGLMIGHIHVPALDPDQGIPASLSEHVIRDLLKDELEYHGLIFTDAMNMKGLTSFNSNVPPEILAFQAGNDILVMPSNIPRIIDNFIKWINTGQLNISEINNRVRRILSAKYSSGIWNTEMNEPANLVSLLNKNAASISAQVFDNAVTIVRNDRKLIPFHPIDTVRFASVVINKMSASGFQHMLDRYAAFDHYNLPEGPGKTEYSGQLLDSLSAYDMVVAGLYGTGKFSSNQFNIDSNILGFLESLNKKTNVVLVVYGIPYCLRLFDEFGELICAYEDNLYAELSVPQILFGAIPARGKLPVSVNHQLRCGRGIMTTKTGRLSFSDPATAHMNQAKLNYIDTIVTKAIRDRAIPGCQVLIAMDGAVVFEKNYGYLTYDSTRHVTTNTVYDLASVTKVAGTLQAMMILTDNEYVDIDKKISCYLPELKNTNKEDLIIRDILTHQSGLQPYIPFWKYTMKAYDRGNNYYSKTEDSNYTTEVTAGMYASENLKDTLWAWMIKTDLRDKEDPAKPFDYKYSDIGFYFIQKLIERVTGLPEDVFLNEFLYTPMGLNKIAYSPKKYFSLEQIAPTEVDNHFRKSLIWGNVNDEIASIYGGVAGHAGLFSNAYDLACIMQMNLQNGYYGGIRYLHPATLKEFTSRQFLSNRRGLGWDKPQAVGDEYNPASYYASDKSYGHSGFTGTYVWVDPEYKLIYVFLSNRTYPDPDNKKLIDEEVRKRIQTVIYSSIIDN